ncbi:MAG: nucleotide pyrophosphohydrolase [Desulfurococcales archaeon]|nr:nucleotide pyrophosphohydrolase [Desulfurococcales archaeon]
MCQYNLTLSCAQRAIREAYLDRDSKRGLHATFTWFIEEIGELAEAILGKRSREGLEEEFADVLAWLLSLANLLDIDVEEAFVRKYGEDLRSTGCLRGS